MFQGRVLQVSVANVKKEEYKKMGSNAWSLRRSSSRTHVQGREVSGEASRGGEQHIVLEQPVSEQRHGDEGDHRETGSEGKRHSGRGIGKHGRACRSSGDGSSRGHKEVAGVARSEDGGSGGDCDEWR